jgi:hypothetical protein
MVNIFYFIKYHFYKFIIRKYRISAIKSYGFYINDYLMDQKNEMDRLFNKYGSDKGGKKKYLGWNPHNYGQIYNDLFSSLRFRKFNLLEVGIGSVDKNIKSSLPSYAKSGASLRAFRDYFKKANIYGCDIDKKTLFKEKRIFTFLLDQTSKKDIKEKLSLINKDFHIIIDDGLHTFEANICFFEVAIKYLALEKNGGGRSILKNTIKYLENRFYIIEDVNEWDMNKYYNYFSKKKKKYRINFYSIHNPSFFGKSNNLIIIRKK